MKKLFILTLALLISSWAHVRAAEGTTNDVPVKMTYVNMDEPDTSYGEIAEGATAEAGYNKISGGSVGFGNTVWGVNYITYLQVDVSSVEGTITNATLSFEGSGATDGKRETEWGAGYNSSTWAADMTYNTADKSITTVGGTKKTTTKAAGTFENISLNITEAFKNVENGVVTILVYETAAAGGYIKNPVVSVDWTTASTYNVTFTETSSAADVKVTVDGSDATTGIALIDGTYTFTATSSTHKDYTGEFTVAGADLNVEFAMTPRATWSYTVKNNVNDDVKTGTCLEGESVTVPYNKYILKDGKVYTKGALSSQYNYSFTPDSNNYITTIEYTATDITDGIYFAEGEDIEGMTPDSSANANIRCSNSAGGHADEAIEICKLSSGTYKVKLGVWGNAGADFVVKAGDETVLTTKTRGYWLEAPFISKNGDDDDPLNGEFTLNKETSITFEGASAGKVLDYILITGTVNVGGVAINGTDGKPLEKLDLNAGTDYQLSAVITPENASNKAVIWSSDKPEIATVDETTGKVTALSGGTATITATSAANAEIKAEVTVTVAVPATGLVVQDKGEALESGAEIKLTVGETYTLTAVVEPEGSTDKVEWKSSDTEVATVANGKITTIKAGEATITATVATFSVAVKVVIAEATVPVTGVKLDKETAEMKTGATLPLTATIEPEDASSKNVAWSSSDDDTATVDQKGIVTAVKAGTVTITASAGDFSAECVITITDIEVTGITLDQTEIKNLVKGETVKLTAKVEPSDATDPTVNWSTSDETIATVDQDGNVTGVAPGTATITATAGEESATCEVTVIIPVDGIALNYREVALFEGKSYQLTATVDPTEASDKTVTWTSSKEEVATVDENGNVTAIAAGEATITAKAGEKTAECKIIVKAIGTIPTEGTVIDQTFNSDTTLEHTDKYIWGPDVKGMITATGIYMTNGNNKAGNYDNRDFITFANAIGSPTQAVNVSYNIFNSRSKGQADTYYEINYFNGNDEFVFGIKEGIGNWTRNSAIITANEDGTTTVSDLPAHLPTIDGKNDSAAEINLNVKISDDTSLIEIDGNIYTAYTSNAGIEKIKLSVSGGQDYSDRSLYIKNFVVKTTEVIPITTATYTVKYVCGEEILKEEQLTAEIGSGISITETQMKPIYNEDKTAKYIYVTNDAEGKTVASDDSTVVTITFREAETYNYVVKNNVNSDKVEGSVLEGESKTVPYHRYILTEDGTVWMKDATNKEYNFTFSPDADDYVAELVYKEYAKDGIYFTEAEDIEGVTIEENGQIATRGSNDAGAYASEAVEVYSLKPGTYKVEIAVAGNAGATLSVYAGGEEPVVSASTSGSWGSATSEEFTLDSETTLTFQGGSPQKVIDYILITGKVIIPATGVTLDVTEKTMTLGEELALTATVTPENATDEITWSSSDSKVATVVDGKVTAVGVGNATITAKAGEFSAECAVKVYPQLGDADWSGDIVVNDAIHIANYVVGKNTVKDEMKEFFMAGADVNKDNSISISDASATVELALKNNSEPAAKAMAVAALNEPADNLVIGALNASANGGSTVAVTLDNSMDYVALQADVYVPEGVNFEVKPGSRIADSHSFQYYRFDDSHVRVAVYTFSGNAFADNDEPLFEIVADSSLADPADISLVRILASDADANEYVLGSRVAGTTGVAALGFDSDAPVKVFDLNGIYVSDSMEGLQQGFYIIRQGNQAKKVRIR